MEKYLLSVLFFSSTLLVYLFIYFIPHPLIQDLAIVNPDQINLFTLKRNRAETDMTIVMKQLLPLVVYVIHSLLM